MMKPQQKPLIYWEAHPPHKNDDCACAATSFTPANAPLLAAQYWEKAPTLRLTPLPDSHTLAFNPYGPAGVVVLNPAARAFLDDFAAPARPTAPTARQLAQLGLLQPVGKKPSLPQAQVDTLTVWMHLSQQCNLRCSYCYLAKEKANMDLKTGQNAVDAVFRVALKRGMKQVELKYAGGEALLNFKLIRQLHRYAHQKAAKSAIQLKEIILGNGTLLSRHTLEFIQQAGINLMISLDGVGKAHDAQRPLVNGGGSFRLVKEGIDRAIECGLKPHISITITGRSAKDAANAVAFALDRQLSFNLNFYRENNYASSEAMDVEDEQLIAAMQAAFAVIEERLPRQSLISALIDRANFSGLHTHTCGVGQNYLVIDHQGQVARCQMDIENPVTDIYVDDPLTLLAETQAGFQNLAVDEKDDCRQCEWRYWCGGGCSLLAYRSAGRVDAKSPYCKVYKTLYPEALRLEGLRLMKWQRIVH